MDDDARQLRCVAQSGLGNWDRIQNLPLSGPGLISRAAASRESIYAPDVSLEPRYLCADERSRSEYAVPLFAGSTLLGVLDIESDQFDGIRAVTRKLVEQVAGQAALAIERSELHKRLRASERQLRSIFEQSPLGVALCDLAGRFIRVNPSLASLLERTTEELGGSTCRESVLAEDREEFERQLRGLLEGRAERSSMELRFTRGSGESVWAAVIASLIRDAEGLPVNLLLMVQDATARKKAAAERERLQEQLFHSQKMKALGTLAGGVAHDFNNLLGVISGYVSLLHLRLGQDNPLQAIVSTIRNSAERAAELTRQLLQFSGQEVATSNPIEIGRVIERVVGIVSGTFDRRILVTADVSRDLPPIEGDASQLELALMNLCLNARDAMSEGGTLTVTASVANLAASEIPPDALGTPGDYLRIEVYDTGSGIETDNLPRIFEPFFTTKEPGKGSGLGLAAVYSTVTNHKGFIRVTSELGRGSEFVMHLPVAAEARVVTPTPDVVPHGGHGRILVVEDEPVMLEFACDAAKELGYEVAAARDGAEACAIFRRESRHITVVLLDMVMPGADWQETIKKLLAQDPSARIVLTSGYNGAREAKRALAHGALGFLGKPYTVEALANALQSALHSGTTET